MAIDLLHNSQFRSWIYCRLMAFIKAAAIHRDMREQTLAFESKSAVNNLNNSDSDWINSVGIG